jgi:hypothetical protein
LECAGKRSGDGALDAHQLSESKAVLRCACHRTPKWSFYEHSNQINN